ncbi:MAG: DUF4197 domain-containing protein [Hyphomonas sp.]|nr:DUF4197 domain-containing protein [Hyphomonas sp.]MCB9963230.1 DUF4197 domain-containing protein [Hyphomonas sp.]MCB9970163.1 DUF4197 domain-containing protein [Hyphomonas sp.]
MKRSMLGALALVLLIPGCADTGTNAELGRVLGQVLNTPTSQGALTNAEIDAGLREALTVGTNTVASQLGRTDGYFADPKIHIPLPKTYRSLQSNLAMVGASGPLDDLELRMNRAAEAAVPQGKQLVIAAVKDMTISDALNILKGGDTAATDYLRAKTQDKLRVAFTPYMKDALASSGAFTAMESVAGQYGVGGVTSSLQSDLTGYAVNLGLDGMFYYVAQEEKKIRENPVARTTELLRRVFGTPV